MVFPNFYENQCRGDSFSENCQTPENIAKHVEARCVNMSKRGPGRFGMSSRDETEGKTKVGGSQGPSQSQDAFSGKMQLVLFMNAIEHVARISRVENFAVFCSRRVVLSVCIGRASNSAQNESSHATVAADTAENGSQ